MQASTEPLDNWSDLQQLLEQVNRPGLGPASLRAQDWEPLAARFRQLRDDQDREGMIELRLQLQPLFARDSITGYGLLQEIDEAAIAAATTLERHADLGHFWGARGHNLHRQGFHRQAVTALEHSVRHYQMIGKSKPALRSAYMIALCQRALGNRRAALEIVAAVLAATPEDDPWRGNPLQVLGWLQRDRGDLANAAATFRHALLAQRLTDDPDILVAGTLADLGEIESMLGNRETAAACFEESLQLIGRHAGLYNRQDARTRMKYAEHLQRYWDAKGALKWLNEADDLIRGYGGYYDLLWRIELGRALAHLRQLDIVKAARRLRSMARYRSVLGLGLPRFLDEIRRRVRRRL